MKDAFGNKEKGKDTFIYSRLETHRIAAGGVGCLQRGRLTNDYIDGTTQINVTI